ncbi:MAG: ABC transporter ATP-binding protein [Vallitalea sp.]|jgi:sn-glycerol 3-phosphate transport system ATP-binding protein|nr:ABC transporter ATP-binding protein [Vallitalea sp.]
MGSIKLKNIKKSFGKDVIIPDLNLTIDDGSFTVLVGPSGCGKSTTLRMIAGLETPTSGNIYIDDKDVVETPPGKRGIAMVFQNYALYPTMTVRKNIEFGLVNKKVPKSERDKTIGEISEIVGLEKYLDRKPSSLSGGQRQRVALARAMVKKPKVFLMDEPLSNLDAKLRAQMRVELIQLHKKLGTTFVYVTHDQVEAMSMGDNIVLMNKGVIMQRSTPKEMYHNPQNVFTSQFIGTPPMNVFDGVLTNDYKIGFRPEKIEFFPQDKDEMFLIKGRVITKEQLGSEVIYSIDTKYGMVMVKKADDIEEENIILGIKYKNIFMFDEQSQRTVLSDKIKKELANMYHK